MASNGNGKNKEQGNRHGDLVCFAHLRWNYVFQRPQHLMTRWARQRRVFFVEEPKVEAGPTRLSLERDASGVWVAVPYLSSSLSKDQARAAHIGLIDQMMADNQIRSFVAWYYTPMAIDFTRHLQPVYTVYDCMDELSAFNGAPKKLTGLEDELFERADLVFTGGHSLYRLKRQRHPNVHPFPSSVDVGHFRQARSEQPDPEDQAGIPHPRLGYFGVIDERTDLDLLSDIAGANPDWQLVMLGPVAKLEPEDLPQAPNIHYLGQKDYADLPVYLAGWDVALLPFANNRATRYISPTKIPEYLAGGTPVVSTPISDVVDPYGRDGLVWIANTPHTFAKAIESALNFGSVRSYWLEQVDAFLADNSWDRTWEAMDRLIRWDGRPKESESGAKNKPGGGPEEGSGPTGLFGGLDRTGPLKEKAAGPGNHHSPDSSSTKAHGNGSNGSSGYNGSSVRKENPRRSSQDGVFDYLIVGAGFAGSVMAERLARGSGKRVLLIDRRPHIGGNAFDDYNEDGLLIHKYGPHIFHTNSRDVFAYLSRFTEWRPYEHRVRASVDGQLVPIPINLDTVNRLYGLNLSSQEVDDFFASVAEPVDEVLTSEDVVVSKVGRDLYEKFFRNYTRKQWGLDPSELDASVTSRVPVRNNRDDRYFSDTYQAMPLHGYTRMFENMLDHPLVHIMVNTDFWDLAGYVRYRELIFTGPVDEYFGFRFGKLPYRSLQFQFKTFHQEWVQPVAVVNYPNEHAYTRVTEFKHLTGQEHTKTSLVYEYPCDEGDPYYPIPRRENDELYRKYKQLADETEDVHFLGRLGTYRYYNMDQVTAQALTHYARLTGQKRSAAITVHKDHHFSLQIPRAVAASGQFD